MLSLSSQLNINILIQQCSNSVNSESFRDPELKKYYICKNQPSRRVEEIQRIQGNQGIQQTKISQRTQVIQAIQEISRIQEGRVI